MTRLYGFVETDLEKVRVVLELATGELMVPHDSLYHGGDYFLMREAGVEVILQRNYDCLDEDLAEYEFPDAKILVYLSGEERAEEIADRLLAQVPEALLLRQASY